MEKALEHITTIVYFMGRNSFTINRNAVMNRATINTVRSSQSSNYAQPYLFSSNNYPFYSTIMRLSTSCTSCKEDNGDTEDKKLKATRIKKLRKINKDLFGDLLETRSMKTKHVKQPSKKSVPKQDKVKNLKHESVESRLKDKDWKSSSVPLENNNSRSEIKEVTSLPKVDRTAKGNPKEAEINWMVKNDSRKRMKIISRSNQPDSVYKFYEQVPTGLTQTMKQVTPYDQNDVQGQSSETLPSVSQVMSSFYDVHSATTMKSKACKDEEVITFANSQAQHNGQFNSHSAENTSDCPNRIKIQEETVSSSSSDSIYFDPITMNPEINVKVKDKENSSFATGNSSTSFISFPYSNPDRPPLHTTTQPEIITLPFPSYSHSDSNSNDNDSKMQSKFPANRLPSVSKILNTTMPKAQAAALAKWQQNMIEKMGEEGFQTYKQNMLNNGKELHRNIQSVLSGTSLDQLSISEPISGHWSSVQGILSQIENVHVLESHVSHPHLNYCGIVDCIAVFRNKLVVIDWKTSQKPKPFISLTYDTPLQIAAYIGAINYDPNYSLKMTEGLIVIAYEDGHNSQVFSMNPFEVSKYWKQWLKRLHQYQNSSNSS